ncbi:MAG: c-type cytochrome [Desulfuromusa sp.]|nr:c-type cytochrome [Desulfuromusa sp.]
MKVITSILLTLFLCGLFPVVAISAKGSEPVMNLIRELGCKGCHMIYGKGSSLATDLTEVGSRLTAAQIEEFLSADPATRTKDFMPSYSSLSREERQLISEYLYNLH